MERELQARNELESGLRTAIPRGEIVPYFEQQIDLATGRLPGSRCSRAGSIRRAG